MNQTPRLSSNVGAETRGWYRGSPPLSSCSPGEGEPPQRGWAPRLPLPALTFQALVEVRESGLSQRPEDGKAFCWPVLVGPQHLQVLGRRRGHVNREETQPVPPQHHRKRARSRIASRGRQRHRTTVAPPGPGLAGSSPQSRAEPPAPREGPSAPGEDRSRAGWGQAGPQTPALGKQSCQHRAVLDGS